MKPLLFAFHLFVIIPAILGQPFGLTLADLSASAGGDTQLLGYLVLFSFVGLGLAYAVYRLFEVCVGELRREQAAGGAKPADPREG